MSSCEETSRRVASIAARGARHPETLTLDEIQTVCASALAQAPHHNAMAAGLLDKHYTGPPPTLAEFMERYRSGY